MILVKKLKYCENCPFFTVKQEDFPLKYTTDYHLKCEFYEMCDRVINLTKEEATQS